MINIEESKKVSKIKNWLGHEGSYFSKHSLTMNKERVR